MGPFQAQVSDTKIDHFLRLFNMKSILSFLVHFAFNPNKMIRMDTQNGENVSLPIHILCCLNETFNFPHNSVVTE